MDAHLGGFAALGTALSWTIGATWLFMGLSGLVGFVIGAVVATAGVSLLFR